MASPIRTPKIKLVTPKVAKTTKPKHHGKNLGKWLHPKKGGVRG